MKRNIFSTLAAAAVAMSAGAAVSRPADAQSVVTSGSDIIGVTGISYNGTLYDATFVDGSCQSIFLSCGGAAPFTFTNSTDADGIASALAASLNLAALLQSGDTLAGITAFGANTSSNLTILTPYATDFASQTAPVSTAVDMLTVTSGPGTTSFSGELGVSIAGNPADSVYAVWTAEATEAPEPASLALLGAGVAGLAAARRQKKRS